mgnify:CR=1 FL=1
MNLINKSTKLFTLIVASGIITSSALAGPCGGGASKPEKVARYKTPQMLAFVDTTIDYLNSKDGSNKRHLKVLNSCLKTFNSGKTSVKGNEAKNLKACRNFMKMDEYNLQKIASNLSEDQLKNNSESPIALKKETKNKTERVTKTIDSTTERDSGLLLF